MNEIVKYGEYFIGDPSFVLPTNIYTNYWGIINNFRNDNYVINDFNFVVHNTHGGDGKFKDSVNREYIVESGFIGMVNTQLIEDYGISKKKGHYFNFKKEANFVYDAGIFTIKSGREYIKIDTINLDEYYSDQEEHCESFKLNDSDTDSIKEVSKFLDEEEDECDEEEDDYGKNKEVIQKSFFKV